MKRRTKKRRGEDKRENDPRRKRFYNFSFCRWPCQNAASPVLKVASAPTAFSISAFQHFNANGKG
jgi:hypothetical protein